MNYLKKPFEKIESDDQSDIEQPTKEEIQKLCELLTLKFNRETAMALIYGDNTMLPERILPEWLKEL
jgi:hypothetical protein